MAPLLHRAAIINNGKSRTLAVDTKKYHNKFNVTVKQLHAVKTISAAGLAVMPLH